ncbi:carbohydrate ABC transporter permease [Rubellicoccus peritrichatus]|uniref:Carbohydrate ABC transporter permease n=1 Tax=Rubellicoccus peritrichatus TaxID=3080537 RepID=A0AAQ3QVU9_9BACT|nr:carbohydrate ABC transporter permease [Puniceicoccus sp. CR14]WOO41280.1 carbohydrate ABC transporter permease [Puniceicoccus sp. CR14]
MPKKISKLGEGIKLGYLCFVLFFAFVPLFIMIVVSFKSNEQYLSNPWFFDHPSTWKWGNWGIAWDTVSGYISNSIFVSVSGTAITLGIVLMASYAIARYDFPGKNVIFYLVMATMFLPGTVAALVTLFDLLMKLNLVNSLWALVVMAAVGGQVAGVFILRNFIEDIPKELFESAQLDGAGHLQQIRHIILPLSASIISVTCIMDFLGSWNNVILPLLLLRDDALLTIPVGLFRLDGEYVKQYGQLMAGYAISSVPLLLIFLFSMRLFVKGLSAGAVKG